MASAWVVHLGSLEQRPALGLRAPSHGDVVGLLIDQGGAPGVVRCLPALLLDVHEEPARRQDEERCEQTEPERFHDRSVLRLVDFGLKSSEPDYYFE
jgi:hypothetical protein